MMEKQYFATLDYKDLGEKLLDRVRWYYEHLTATGRMYMYQNVYETYYSGYYNEGDVKRAGDASELRKVQINHFRNILQHIITLTASNRPSWEPQAINTDYESMSQAILAQGLLDYYLKTGNLDRYVWDVVESAVVYGEGHMYVGWDPFKGEAMGATDDGVVMNGDICVHTYNPTCVIRDVTRTNTIDHDWYITLDFMNRYELAARYKQYEDEIIDCGHALMDKYNFFWVSDARGQDKLGDSIAVFTFIHNKNAALPRGRQTIFIEDGTVLFDGDLPYQDMPLCSMYAGEQKMTAYGYTVAFDLLQVQKCIDAAYSTIVSNQNAFGLQNIVTDKGGGVEIENIGNGLRVITKNAGSELKPLELLKTPTEIFNFSQQLVHDIETLSGVNSVARGNPEASLKSGAALAMVQSMAVQFASALQNAYAKFLETAGTALINTLKKYATSPRVAMIAGKSNRQYIKEFQGNDLSSISRVVVNVGSPMMRTTAGRIQIAQDLLNTGMVKTPEQYIQVIETGRFEPLIEGERAELLLIKDENEKMGNGEMPPVIMTDLHHLHIQEHTSVLASTDARNNPQVVDNTLTHIQTHIIEWQRMDPSLIMLLKMPAPMMPPPMMPPGPEPGGPPIPGAEPEPQPARMPTNPMTGKQADAATGGL